MSTYKILVLHGPNLNLLGSREPDVYGQTTLDEINKSLAELAEKLGIEIVCFQSNSEGAIIDHIQETAGSCSGILINPAALTHYSYSLRDALTAVDLPLVEVHLSNIFNREEFRRKSVISDIAQGVISGLGARGYLFGLEALCSIIERSSSS